MSDDFDSSFSGAGGFSSSQTTKGAEKKSTKLSRMAPVMISSVYELLPGQEQMQIGSEVFSCVTIVGIVRNVHRSGLAIFYEIDDMSGPPLTVRYYSGDSDEEPVAMENTYVRVYGALKTFNNKHSLMVFRIMPLEDLNELSMHLLEVAQCKMLFEKDAVQSLKNKTHPAMSAEAVQPAITPKFQQNVAPAGLGSKSSGMNQVFAYIKQSKSDEGVSTDELKRVFRNFTEQQLTQFLDFLCGEGQIYTTTDDFHFRVTD